jgi:AraC-like DNA-binding protein
MRRESRQLLLGDQSVGCERMQLDTDVLPHTHDYCELAIVLGGSARHSTDRGSRRVRTGDVVVVRPGSWHGYTGCHRLDLANVYLAPELVGGRLSWILDDPGLAMLILHGGETGEPVDDQRLARITGWLQQLAESPAGTAVSDRMLRHGLLCCVLAALSEARFDHHSTPAMISEPVRRALELMADDLAHPWSVRELAGAVNLSDAEFQRRFREQIGVTPIGWLIRSRAERAATWLVSSADPIAVIGRRVGWSDPNYMSRRFRKMYGASPREYRHRYGFAGRTPAAQQRSRAQTG